MEAQYRKKVQCVPRDLLRRAFMQLASSPEAFLVLRSHFVSTLATLSMCQYVLGIGDRHLSNFMVDMESGGVIGIDFGHNFGTATQVWRIRKSLLSLLDRAYLPLLSFPPSSPSLPSLSPSLPPSFLPPPVSPAAGADAFPTDPSVHQPPPPPQRGGAWLLWPAPQLHGAHPQGTAQLPAPPTQHDGCLRERARLRLEGNDAVEPPKRQYLSFFVNSDLCQKAS